jgi:hypothetical protein
MPKDGRYDDLAAFLRLRGDELMRTAVLLAPGREGGEDLLQEALERIMGKWHKIDGDPEGFGLPASGWIARSVCRLADGLRVWAGKSGMERAIGLLGNRAIAQSIHLDGSKRRGARCQLRALPPVARRIRSVSRSRSTCEPTAEPAALPNSCW